VHDRFGAGWGRGSSVAVVLPLRRFGVRRVLFLVGVVPAVTFGGCGAVWSLGMAYQYPSRYRDVAQDLLAIVLRTPS
jgi:hypothetical protein